jgi:hypothetical protein
MNGKNKLENLKKNLKLGAEESANRNDEGGSMDERLNSAGQMAIRQVVKALPEEMPSLAWRSALNERLAASTAARHARRRRWLFGGSSFAGLALAAGLALVVFMPRHVEPSAGPSTTPVASRGGSQSGPLLDELLASHNDSVTSQDVVGAGLTSQEVQSAEDDSEAQPTS